MKLTPEERRERRRAAWRRYYAKHHTVYNAKKRAKRAAYFLAYNAKRRAEYHALAETGYFRDVVRRRQEKMAQRPKPTCCEVCGNDKVRIEFDHCHRRGIFRGWLCLNCNAALGHVRDDPDRLRKLIAYLERTEDLIPPQMTLPL